MLSPLKIILLAVVVGAVFIIARQFRKKDESGEISANKQKKATNQTTELQKCPDCETYVASLEDHVCEK